MREFTQTAVWRRTLAPRGRDEQDPDRDFRARLSASFSLCRDRARDLAAAIPEGMRHLTVHDQTHLDALWEIADIIEANPQDCVLNIAGGPGALPRFGR